jgi:hypothetical protein
VRRIQRETDVISRLAPIFSRPTDNYHEFCRLLAQLKTNYQLAELVGMSQYSEAMGGIVNFSIVSLENWHMAPNSVHYVLGFWERLIKGIPYSNCEKRDHNLNLYSPQIMQAYIKVRGAGAMVPAPVWAFVLSSTQLTHSCCNCSHGSTL